MFTIERFRLINKIYKAATGTKLQYKKLYGKEADKLQFGEYKEQIGKRYVPEHPVDQKKWEIWKKDLIKDIPKEVLDQYTDMELNTDILQQYARWYYNENDKSNFIFDPIKQSKQNNTQSQISENERFNPYVAEQGDVNQAGLSHVPGYALPNKIYNDIFINGDRNESLESKIKRYQEATRVKETPYYQIQDFKKAREAYILPFVEKYIKDNNITDQKFIKAFKNLSPSHIYGLQFNLGYDLKDQTGLLSDEFMNDLKERGYFDHFYPGLFDNSSNSQALEQGIDDSPGQNNSTTVSVENSTQSPIQQPSEQQSKEKIKQNSTKATQTSGYPNYSKQKSNLLDKKAKRYGFKGWKDIYDKQKALGFKGKDLDGDLGPKTINAFIKKGYLKKEKPKATSKTTPKTNATSKSKIRQADSKPTIAYIDLRVEENQKPKLRSLSPNFATDGKNIYMKENGKFRKTGTAKINSSYFFEGTIYQYTNKGWVKK